MAAQVKVDEDLPEAVADLFATAGYGAATVRQQGWNGLDDDVLWERIQAEGRWLVTADKGFGDVRMYVPGSYAGVIVLRAEIESRRRYMDLAQALIRSVRLEEVAGCLVVVTLRGIRIRRPSGFTPE